MTQQIYLGPRLQHLGLGYATVFRNGIHPSIKVAIEVCPAIGSLIVDVREAAVVRRELNFDFAHNMKGGQGKYVTFYREVENWLATQAKPNKATPNIEVKHHA